MLIRDWSTSCPDWEKRLLAKQSLVPDLPLFEDEAEKAIRVFNRLRIPDILGTPTMAEVCGAWVYPIVRALFGSYNPETHIREIQEYFLLIAKKNGKSSLGGALMLVAMIVNRHPNAEYLLVAPTKEIAGIAFKQAVDTIKLDKALLKIFHTRNDDKSITHRRTNAVLKIKAADTDVITGAKPTGVMIDETHEFAKKSKAADIFVELRGGLITRPHGFIFQTTTQSKDTPAGVFKQELENARNVRDGKLSLRLLPILYELPRKMQEDEAWKDPKTWPLVNPNFGLSINEQVLQDELKKGEIAGRAEYALKASQFLNVEIGLRLSADRWAGADHWEKAVDKTLTLDQIKKRSDVIIGGIDGGGLDDLLALTFMGRDIHTRQWMSWSHAWADRSVLELRKEIAPRLLDFEKQGDLTFVDDMQEAFDDLAARCSEIDELGLLAEIGIDPSGVGLIVDALAAVGISGNDRIKGVFQDRPLQGAIKSCEVKVKNKSFVHCYQPIVDWAVGNAKVEHKTNYIMVTKAASGTAKIDPLMSIFDAADRMGRNPSSSRSAYEDEDILV